MEAGRHLDPSSAALDAVSAAGPADDNDDFQDPLTAEEVRNECMRFRAWNKFKESFTVFCGFLTTYFKSTTWPKTPSRHHFCQETLV